MAKNDEGTLGSFVAQSVIFVSVMLWLGTDLTFKWSVVPGLILAMIAWFLCDVWLFGLLAKHSFQEAIDLVKSEVNYHFDTLSKKRKQLTRFGDYDEVVDDKWRKEIKTFLYACLNIEQLSSLMGMSEKEAVLYLIDYVDSITHRSENQSDGSGFSHYAEEHVNEMSGLEYEDHCAEIFEDNGWIIKRTPLSGDFGVDLLVQKEGRLLAVQCKRFSGSVGVKAVQEAYSGMAHYEAGESMVISNSTFTPAAKHLADRLGVRLLHHLDIDDV